MTLGALLCSPFLVYQTQIARTRRRSSAFALEYRQQRRIPPSDNCFRRRIPAKPKGTIRSTTLACSVRFECSVPFGLQVESNLRTIVFTICLPRFDRSRTRPRQPTISSVGTVLLSRIILREPVCSGICTNNSPQGKRKQAERPRSVAETPTGPKALEVTSPASVRFVWFATAFPHDNSVCDRLRLAGNSFRFPLQEISCLIVSAEDWLTSTRKRTGSQRTEPESAA